MPKITREAIIEAAKRVAEEVIGPISRADFERVTGIGQHHIYRLFPEGGWSEVKRLSDIELHPQHKPPRRDINQEKIIEAAKQAAEKVSGPLSRTQFERITGISQYHIYKLFPESGWSEVRRLAGLERHPKDMVPLSDEQLLQEYHAVASSIGQIPTWSAFAHRSSISADVIRRRFRGTRGTLERYQDWLKEHKPDSQLLIEVQQSFENKALSLRPMQTQASNSTSTHWEKIEGPEFGPPINFRGLRHAPINEQGVVFLFGTVSNELGFIVEAVHASYPDCAAKRCIDKRRQRWQQVRIEFEYKSRNFRDHGHDPGKCDLIVCWEHNWPDCPLDVIELKKVIEELEG